MLCTSLKQQFNSGTPRHPSQYTLTCYVLVWNNTTQQNCNAAAASFGLRGCPVGVWYGGRYLCREGGRCI